MCYETNLTDSQWEIIAEILEDGRKRQHSLQVIVNAIFYVTKTGVQWRNLLRDFPKWQLVYYYFRKWSMSGLIGKIHQILYEQVRLKENREVSPSLGLLDSQSVKTASVTEDKGLDANKKINGRKRFVVTDTLGWRCCINKLLFFNNLIFKIGKFAVFHVCEICNSCKQTSYLCNNAH